VQFSEKKDHREIEIPCGQCIGCRINRQQMWAFRCLAEASLSPHNWFLTLTYDDANLPPRGELRHRDWQLFAKRVRRALGPFRYLMCGEYGEQTKRPHYHALLFGLDLPDVDRFSVRRGYPVFKSATLARLWGRGLHEIGTVTPQSARYCSGYVLKDCSAPTWLDDTTGELMSLKAPYGRMSLRPGLGDAWIRRYYPEVFTHGACYAQDTRYRIPDRFKDLLDTIDPDAYEDLQERAVEKALASPDNTAARLAVRERCALAKHSRYKEAKSHAI